MAAPGHDGVLRAPWWLPGGHAQTIIPALYGRAPEIPLHRRRWTTPDNDFIDLDWTLAPENLGQPADPDRALAPCALSAAGGTHHQAPLVVLFHGLEGSARSHYARALMAAVRARGWPGVVVHFRGCSGEMNLAPRFYHSGDSGELDWVLQRLHRDHCQATHRPLYVIGVSLGGNALLRLLGERRDAAKLIQAACAVSAPLDLPASGAALARGFNRVYTQTFLRTLKTKCEAKLRQFPGLFDAGAMRASRDLHAFDNVVTAPLHGYRDADDYWRRASSKPVLREIAVPALVLNARNDPFLPGAHLPGGREVSDMVRLEQPEAGGHVGFIDRHASLRAMRLDWLPERLLGFCAHGA